MNKTKNEIINPYNRLKIDETIISEVNEVIRYTLFMKFPIELNIEEDEDLTKEQKQLQHIYKIFEKIDELGNYSNCEWLLELNRYKLFKYIKELYDIWNYRISIDIDTKTKICHPFGNPFRLINLHNLTMLSHNEMLEKVLIIIDGLIFKSINDEYASLGAIYVLTALTLVSKKCADALPWLYETALY